VGFSADAGNGQQYQYPPGFEAGAGAASTQNPSAAKPAGQYLYGNNYQSNPAIPQQYSQTPAAPPQYMSAQPTNYAAARKPETAEEYFAQRDAGKYNSQPYQDTTAVATSQQYGQQYQQASADAQLYRTPVTNQFNQVQQYSSQKTADVEQYQGTPASTQMYAPQNAIATPQYPAHTTEAKDYTPQRPGTIEQYNPQTMSTAQYSAPNLAIPQQYAHVATNQQYTAQTPGTMQQNMAHSSAMAMSQQYLASEVTQQYDPMRALDVNNEHLQQNNQRVDIGMASVAEQVTLNIQKKQESLKLSNQSPAPESPKETQEATEEERQEATLNMNPERQAMQRAKEAAPKKKKPRKPPAGMGGLCFEYLGSGSCQWGKDCPQMHSFWRGEGKPVEQLDGDDPHGLDFIFGVEDPDRGRGRGRGRGRSRGRSRGRGRGRRIGGRGYRKGSREGSRSSRRPY